jgi:hypothetical protein
MRAGQLAVLRQGPPVDGNVRFRGRAAGAGHGEKKVRQNHVYVARILQGPMDCPQHDLDERSWGDHGMTARKKESKLYC